MESIIVQEYIESLNESKELDCIFPILLENMGFRLVSTPKNSKGQSQYGKDVIAVRKEEDGQYYKYYFELKGFFAKDIDDTSFYAKDGFRESILAAKDTAYNDASIPLLRDLPRKIVFVHNGILKENTRPTLDGFVSSEFPTGGFERWDIYKLTELFSNHLFNESLFLDAENVRLFKRTLVLLDAPDNDFPDFKQLIGSQLNKIDAPNIRSISGKREIASMFAAIKLMVAVIYKYSKNNDNLFPAKECVNYAVLRTWSWILKHKMESKKNIISKFNGLVIIQSHVYYDYIQKTLPLALCHTGLYGSMSPVGEEICYPLRCFDYLNDLIYFYEVSNAYDSEDNDQKLIQSQKDIVKSVIVSNSGCVRPLLDNHSITIQLVLGFILRNSPSECDSQFVSNYICQLTINLITIFRRKKRLPELNSNRLELAKSNYAKTENYCDKSSLLLTLIFELLSYINADVLYKELKKAVEESGVNLQVAYPLDDINIEQLLFEKMLFDEFAVETSIKLPEELTEFTASFKKRYNSIDYRTDKAGYGLLRLLAHIHYRTDFFPDFLNFGFCIPLDSEIPNS